MKPNLHPEYIPVHVTCACGNKFETRSTRGSDFTVDICANCHPFFTGKQKLMDTEGRVEKFRNKYKNQKEAAAKEAAKAPPAAAAKPAAKEAPAKA